MHMLENGLLCSFIFTFFVQFLESLLHMVTYQVFLSNAIK